MKANSDFFFLQQNTSQSIPGISSDFECCTFSIFILQTDCIVCMYIVCPHCFLRNECFNNLFTLHDYFCGIFVALLSSNNRRKNNIVAVILCPERISP